MFRILSIAMGLITISCTFGIASAETDLEKIERLEKRIEELENAKALQKAYVQGAPRRLKRIPKTKHQDDIDKEIESLEKEIEILREGSTNDESQSIKDVLDPGVGK